MPQITINSSNIKTFGFSVTFDLYNKSAFFDTSTLTEYNGGGISNVQGIAFSVIDSDGVTLASIDFNSPQIIPSVDETWQLDLSSFGHPFLFQSYKIIGQIKDQDGSIYSTEPVYPKICEPVNFTSSGYVPGMFQVQADCVNNNLIVQELTNLSYNNLLPVSKTKEGIFSYPTGTISPISFENTPWTNNVIYTGENRVECDTEATYDLGSDMYVVVLYRTDNAFPITCSNKMSQVACCIVDLQTQYEKNCDNSKGAYAKGQLDSVLPSLLTGFLKEMNGQDASKEVDFIKKKLSCNCGDKTIKQNESLPINPSVYNIVLTPQGGVSIPSATVVGNTKQYIISSNIYQVVKGDTGDLSFTIDIDTSVPFNVKYKLTLNKSVLASDILTAIGADPALITQLNSLIDTANFNFDLSNINGKCIIDLSSTNYFLTTKVPSSAATFVSITIGSTTYTAPSPIPVNQEGSIEAYLNGLGLGTFEVSFSLGTTGAYFSILTTSNPNNIQSAVVSNSTVLFQKTNKSLNAFLQALVDYLCALNTLQVSLGTSLSLCYIDYNGNIAQYNYTSLNNQDQFNQGIQSVICNLANKIVGLNSVTCQRMKEIFVDSPTSSFNQATDRILGFIDGSCIGITGKQLGMAVIGAINANQDVKTAFCAIDCSTPVTCPDISAINASIVSGNIGVYGVVFNGSTSASQTLTVRYKLSSNPTWIVATNALGVFANGTVSGTSPYQISGLTPGQTYDLQVYNNCGGVGSIMQITVPTSTIYSGQFYLDTSIYTICGQSTVTLYSNSPFASGVTMYSDSGASVPVTGYNFIAPLSGQIYQINSGSGIVGVNTGNSCSSGVGGSYILGNDAGIICSGSAVTLYTNGAFAVGGILYSDASLTNPVTGYSYVVNVSNNTIYHLNSSTGVIGVSTGSACSSYVYSYDFSVLEIDICTGASPNTSWSYLPFGVGVQLFHDQEKTMPINGYNYVKDAGGMVYNIDIVTGIIGAPTGNAC